VSAVRETRLAPAQAAAAAARAGAGGGGGRGCSANGWGGGVGERRRGGLPLLPLRPCHVACGDTALSLPQLRRHGWWRRRSRGRFNPHPPFPPLLYQPPRSLKIKVTPPERLSLTSNRTDHSGGTRNPVSTCYLCYWELRSTVGKLQSVGVTVKLNQTTVQPGLRYSTCVLAN
jgi:hypothetical protein